MKVLYAIQGTGNGHISRAREVIPALKKKCIVDILVSGTQADVSLDEHIKYRLRGLSFIFGKNGGVDIWETLKRSKISELIREIKKLEVQNYDLVINDFEPVSAWACRLKKIPCISLSHQSSILSKYVPRPKRIDLIGEAILKNYAPAKYHIGFHFGNYDKNIFTPVIRKDIREMEVEDRGHYAVYLPSYDDSKIIEVLKLFKNVRWQVFSKHSTRSYQHGNILVNPITNELFSWSLAKCKGVLCGAGFETPAEAIYLGKKLMVIPMSNQIEQQYNAAALKKIGIPVINKLHPSNYSKIEEWIKSDHIIEIKYPEVVDIAINRLFDIYIREVINSKKKTFREHLEKHEIRKSIMISEDV